MVWCNYCEEQHPVHPCDKCPVCGDGHEPPGCPRKVEMEMPPVPPVPAVACAWPGCDRPVTYSYNGAVLTYNKWCERHQDGVCQVSAWAQAMGISSVRTATSSGNSEVGRKDDQSKLRYDLLPEKAERFVVEVLTHGARKYGDDNWRYVPDARKRYLAAAMRHLAAYRAAQDADPDSGLPHLAHAVCSLMFLLELDA